MSDIQTLLPPSATPQMRAVETATADKFVGIGHSGGPISVLWDVDTCPVDILPWLAWSLSVEVWDPAWPEHVKRQAIKAAISVHRVKGTKQSVLAAFAALDMPATISEWFEHGGAPHTFIIEFLAADLSAAGRFLDQSTLDLISSVLANTKPVRAHYQVRVSETVTNTIHVSPSFGEVMIDDADMIMEMP